MMWSGLFGRTITGLILVLLVAIMSHFPAAQSQERRRQSRRVTNPVRTPRSTPRSTPPADSTPDEPEASVISTADEATTRREEAVPSSRRGQTRRRVEPETEEQVLRRTVDRLSSQVTELSEDLGQIKDQQRTLVDLERLSRAEQRAENLRAQLRDVLEKEAALQARAEQLEFDILPENIERRAALTGTLRPTELREQIRRQLESERGRVRAQLDLFISSRIRLEAGVAKADAEAERIRTRLDATDPRPETGTNITEPPLPSPTPTPQNDSQDNTPR